MILHMHAVTGITFLSTSCTQQQSASASAGSAVVFWTCAVEVQASIPRQGRDASVIFCRQKNGHEAQCECEQWYLLILEEAAGSID